VISLSRPLYRARGGHELLRPELAAVLGGWPQSQLAEGVGDTSCLLLSGVVAALGCCIATARTVQGMARVRAGQAPAPVQPGARQATARSALGPRSTGLLDANYRRVPGRHELGR
jgi:hypothetical protein